MQQTRRRETFSCSSAKNKPEMLVFLAPVDASTFGVAGAGSRGRRRGRHRGTEAVGSDPERRHVLLRLEQDDVDLGSEEAAEHHRAAQAHRDAHGGGLHLQDSSGVCL